MRHNKVTTVTRPYSYVTASPFFLSVSLFVRKYGWRTGQPSGVTHSTGWRRTLAMTSAHVTSQSWWQATQCHWRWCHFNLLVTTK